MRDFGYKIRNTLICEPKYFERFKNAATQSRISEVISFSGLQVEFDTACTPGMAFIFDDHGQLHRILIEE